MPAMSEAGATRQASEGPRRRGAPKGNRNAVKHGRHARPPAADAPVAGFGDVADGAGAPPPYFFANKPNNSVAIPASFTQQREAMHRMAIAENTDGGGEGVCERDFNNQVLASRAFAPPTCSFERQTNRGAPLVARRRSGHGARA